MGKILDALDAVIYPLKKRCLYYTIYTYINV